MTTHSIANDGMLCMVWYVFYC